MLGWRAAYFRKLGLTEEEAAHLHHEYYKVRCRLSLYSDCSLTPLPSADVRPGDPRARAASQGRPPRLRQALRPGSSPRNRPQGRPTTATAAERYRPGEVSCLGFDERLCQRQAVPILLSLACLLTLALVSAQHAVRVLKLLGISEFFEGIVSCDYGAGDFSCKPEAGAPAFPSSYSPQTDALTLSARRRVLPRIRRSRLLPTSAPLPPLLRRRLGPEHPRRQCAWLGPLRVV